MPPQTDAQRQAASRKRKRTIECPPVDDMDRRRSLEKDPMEWLRHFMEGSFDAPFSDGHKKLIAGIVTAAETGEGTATAQPRGEGKSTACRGTGFYLQAIGAVRFSVLVGWKHSDATAAFKMWLRMLSDSPEFLADYPEIAAPFHYSTHATALSNLTWKNTIEELGVYAGMPTGASVDTMHKLIQLPNNLGAIAARSAMGDAKGLNTMLLDGSTLRPDFLLIDDAQDPTKADNPDQVSKTIDILENVFLQMAGPRTRLSAAVACTVEHADDVSEYWLNKEGWSSVRVSRIEKWPDGSEGGTWESEETCPIRTAWDEWNQIRTTKGKGSGQKGANKYFTEHQEMMTGKMEVSWEHRYTKHDVCAIDAAMRDWYKAGPNVFARGQQNKPIKEGSDAVRLVASQVSGRIDSGRMFKVVPEWADKIIVSTDINPSYALTTTIVAFGNDQRAAVVWYGTHKMSIAYEMPNTQKQSATMLELQKHGRQIAEFGFEIDVWLVDGGGGGNPSNAVERFCTDSRHTVKINALPAFGVPEKQLRFKPSTDKKHEQALVRRGKHRWDRWCRFNQDYWGEVALHSWMGAMGAPGTCDLPLGNHYHFADQMTREWVESKELRGDEWVYKWHTSTDKHDYFDCIKMAFVGAALNGIGTGATRRKKTKKIARVVIGGRR